MHPFIKTYLPALLSTALLTGYLQAGDGTWDGLSGGNRSDPDLWIDGNVASGVDATANFAQPTANQTINLNQNVTIGHLQLSGIWNSSTFGYTLAGDSILNFATSGAVPTIALDQSNTNPTQPVGFVLTIDSALSGNQGLKIVSTPGHNRSRIVFNTAQNDLTGGIEVTGRSTIVLGNLSGFGNNTVTLSGNANYASSIMFGTARQIGTVTNDFVLNEGIASLFTGHLGQEITLTGTISEKGGSRRVRYQGGASHADTSVMILNGNNSYSGDSEIVTNLRLRLAHSNALGIGNSKVEVALATIPADADRNTLELSNNITVSNKTLHVRGTGFQGKGSLNNVSGNNTWQGDVVLEGTAESYIGAATGTRLSITGNINQASGASSGLRKVGEGDLVLTAANTYSTGTRIAEGRILAANNSALGSGAVRIDGNAGLGIEAGTQLTVSSLIFGDSGAQLFFSLNGDFDATQLLVSGDQLGNSSYMVGIANGGGLTAGNYTLLTVAGTAEAMDFILTDSQISPELLGELTWADSVLSLNVTAVPEPATLALLTAAATLGATVCLRRRKTRAQN